MFMNHWTTTTCYCPKSSHNHPDITIYHRIVKKHRRNKQFLNKTVSSDCPRGHIDRRFSVNFLLDQFSMRPGCFFATDEMGHTLVQLQTINCVGRWSRQAFAARMEFLYAFPLRGTRILSAVLTLLSEIAEPTSPRVYKRWFARHFSLKLSCRRRHGRWTAKLTTDIAVSKSRRDNTKHWFGETMARV